MRILVCAAAAPLPPRTGFTLVVEAVVAELQTRHDVHVVAYRQPGQTGTASPGMDLVVARDRGPLAVAAALLRARPRYASRLGPDLGPAVRAGIASHQPDVVLVFSGRLAGLRDDLGQRPTVIVPLDAVHLGIATRQRASHGVKRRLLGLEARLVRRYERTAYRRYDRVVVVSDRDRDALLELDPSLRVEVIPNGVDLDAFRPDPSAQPDPRRIVFTGVMDSPGNVVAAEVAAREVLPLVRARVPDARLVIVGRDPAARVRALGHLDGVEVTGAVPAVAPWLTGSRVFLCPMVSGTGVKNKLLEAMASGLPCVATPLGLGGLDVRDGQEVLVGDAPAGLADALVRVLTDDDLAARLGRAARAYVDARHRWPEVGRRYERLLMDLRT